MIYLDSSVLVPYLVSEPQSHAVEEALGKLRQDVAISYWTEAELVSALGRKVRNRECSEATLRRTVAQMRSTVAASFIRLAPAIQDFEQAITFMLNPKTGLRAGDALQLAIAQRHGATVWTFDQGMLAAAHTLKIPARTL